MMTLADMVVMTSKRSARSTTFQIVHHCSTDVIGGRVYWIKMGMADWLEVEKQEYIDFVDFAESSRARDMQWQDTEDQLSEFDLDHQAWFQPFNKLKDGQDGRDLHKRRG